jgi:hypothetical protein
MLSLNRIQDVIVITGGKNKIYLSKHLPGGSKLDVRSADERHQAILSVHKMYPKIIIQDSKHKD